MATTTNYGWTTPDDTALVKDGASAIRTLGTSVDTTTKNLNPSTTLGDIEYRSSTANTNTRLGIGTSGQALTVVAGAPSWAASATSVLTTTGDTLYASGANTLARLGIGSTGQVLTVAAGLPSWATPSASTESWSLLNSPSGTALTGATTITVSGISGKNQIMILVSGASSGSATQGRLRLNTDTGSNYYTNFISAEYPTTYDRTAFTSSNAVATSIPIGDSTNNAAGVFNSVIFLKGCNGSGLKVYQAVGGGIGSGAGTNQLHAIGGGYYNSATVISSISIVNNVASNFDAGTVYVYTSVV